jgi:sulfofructose kinase
MSAPGLAPRILCIGIPVRDLTFRSGPRGTIWLNPHRELEETPAFAVDAVDTLGAGDVFHGAFTLAVAEGRDLRGTLRFASAAAALKCTRFGGALAAAQRIEVEELLRRTQGGHPTRTP